MVSRGLTLAWHAPCAPSCLKIYLCYEFFPLLNSSFTILCSYFCSSLCFLSAPNRQCSPFLLTRFYYKIPVLRKKEADNHYPSELVSEIRQHFVLHSYNLEILSLLATLHSFAVSLYIHCLLRCACSVTSRCP